MGASGQTGKLAGGGEPVGGNVEFESADRVSLVAKERTGDAKRREKVEVPQEIEFQIKPETALDQMRRAMVARVARGVVWLMSPKS